MKNSLIKSQNQIMKNSNNNVTVYDKMNNVISSPKKNKKFNKFIPPIVFFILFIAVGLTINALTENDNYKVILRKKITSLKKEKYEYEKRAAEATSDEVSSENENESSSATPITKDKCGVIIDKGFNEINGKKVYWFEVKEEGSVDTYIMSGVHEIVWKYSEVGKSTACK